MKIIITFSSLLALWLSSCAFNSYSKVTDDFREIVRTIQDNDDVFPAPNDKFHTTYNTKYLQKRNLEKGGSLSKLIQLLEQNGIHKIYVFFDDEVWLVVEEKAYSIVFLEYLVGFTKQPSIEKARVSYFNPEQVRNLGDGWYSLVYRWSYAD